MLFGNFPSLIFMSRLRCLGCSYGRKIKSLLTMIRSGNPGRTVNVGCTFKFLRVHC